MHSDNELLRLLTRIILELELFKSLSEKIKQNELLRMIEIFKQKIKLC